MILESKNKASQGALMVVLTMFPCLIGFSTYAKKCKVSEFYAFLLFMQKFKMATKSGWKTSFWENQQFSAAQNLPKSL